MAKFRCSQCDKELPVTWSEASANWEPICPECALRDMRKKSIRRRRILDTSVRKKAHVENQPQVPAQPQSQAQGQAPTQAEATTTGRSSQRAQMPLEIELDTDDPLLLAAQNAEAEEQKGVNPMEETTQIRKPKPPPGPQVRLNF